MAIDQAALMNLDSDEVCQWGNLAESSSSPVQSVPKSTAAGDGKLCLVVMGQSKSLDCKIGSLWGPKSLTEDGQCLNWSQRSMGLDKLLFPSNSDSRESEDYNGITRFFIGVTLSRAQQ